MAGYGGVGLVIPGAQSTFGPTGPSHSAGGDFDPSYNYQPSGIWTPKGIQDFQSGPPTAVFGLRQQAQVTYDFATDGGAIGAIAPANNFLFPKNSIILNAILDWTIAVTSGGTSTVAIGTSAGSSETAILAATAKASLTGLVQGVPVPSTASTFVKLTAAGLLIFTVATTALTAGRCRAWIEYIVAPE